MRDPTYSGKDQVYTYAQKQRKSKIFSITVMKCFNLTRHDSTYNSKDMMPFYYYQFYTFEYYSPIVQG